MPAERRRVAGRLALRCGPFRFDRTLPAERDAARFILDAPPGRRAARMRRLILLGHAAHVAAQARPPSSPASNDGPE